MENKICCIFNLAPHYRYPIYKLMDTELKCNFYFGDKVESDIKKLDYTRLIGFKKELKNEKILGTSFSWQKGAWQLIFKKYKFFVITGEPYYISNWVIIILGKFLGKKVIPWSHGIKGDSTNKMEWFERYFFKLCPIVLLYGNYSRNLMIRKGFNSDKLICIYNSLDYKKQMTVRKQLRKSDIFSNYFKNDSAVIIYVGRIQKSKNLESLIKVLKDLNSHKSECNLVFIGKDLGDNQVVETSKKLKIQNKIWFYGPCYEEEKIGELIFNAAVCVSPGPVGLTALHSLTYGTPVITNDAFEKQMPEFEVIVPGKTGDFFKNDKLKDLQKKIKIWITLNHEERLEVRKNCYEIIDSNWNPESQLNTLKTIFTDEED